MHGISRKLRRTGVIGLVAVVTAALLSVAAPGAYAGDGYFTDQDLGATSGAPFSGGSVQMSGWQTPWDLSRHIAYLDRGGSIVIASLAAGSSTWSWLYPPQVQARGPRLSTFTYSWDRSSHVAYTGSDNHVHELWSSQNSPAWHEADLTAASGAPGLLGVVSGYEQGGNQHVIAVLPGSSIWELWFTPGVGWRSVNLSQVTHTALSDSGTQVVAIGRGDTYGQAIAYVAKDESMHVLSWTPDTSWIDIPVGQLAHASAVYNGLSIFQSGGGSLLAVLYYAKTGAGGSTSFHLHELYWTESTGWADVDVTQATGAPGQAVASPGTGLFFEADASDHVFTIGINNAIREFVRTRDDRRVSWQDTADGTADHNGSIVAFAAKDDPQGHSYTEYVAYLDLKGSPHVMDLSAPWS